MTKDISGTSGQEPIHILAIVGSYRKGGVVDSAVDLMLEQAGKEGGQTAKIYLVDHTLDYCTNCRGCTQEAGTTPGRCGHEDDMQSILDRVAECDILILGSPMNFGTVTAVTKTFIERLLCFAYWPWGARGPQVRNRGKPKIGLVLTSSAAPAFMARYRTQIVKLLKQAVGLLGAHPAGVLCIGLAAQQPRQDIGKRSRRRALALIHKAMSKARANQNRT